MKNNFSVETQELFIWTRECWWCGKTHSNCIHHILGRCSNSPLNAALMNNFECHIGNGKLSQTECQKKLLLKTYSFLKGNGYRLTTKDKEFIKEHKEYYENNLFNTEPI